MLAYPRGGLCLLTQGMDYETPVCLGVDATLTIEDVWDHEFRSADFGQNIHHYPYHYCYKNCEVTHHGSDLKRKYCKVMP